jgi:acyl-coenzyme A synthetase/AMP-(fatty) acid ligase
MIVFRDTLPREDTGKIFKRKLRDEFTQALANKTR